MQMRKNRFFMRIVGFFSIIMSVRETCADWHKDVAASEDPVLKGKKDNDGFDIKVPRRNVGTLETRR